MELKTLMFPSEKITKEMLFLLPLDQKDTVEREIN